MEQVLGVVGHELRTPLGRLRAMTEFFTTDGARGTAEFERMLGGIGAEAVRMSETVNELLAAARLNSGLARWTGATSTWPPSAPMPSRPCGRSSPGGAWPWFPA